MYRGFQLQGSAFTDMSHQSAGEHIFSNFNDRVLHVLNEYVLAGGALDGTKMQDDWFPSFKANIFISHSHENRTTAIALAGWLYDSFGLTSFIDSCIWGHADDLQLAIDKKYCKNISDNNYNYKKRNYATAHVHMMLNAALTKMIDRCECLFFLKTPESTVSSIINDHDRTRSPWIYSELATSRLIRKKVPKRSDRRKLLKAFSESETINENLRIEYQIELDHLETLTATDLALWQIDGNQLWRDEDKHPLDILYGIKPLNRKLL
jgi:hypothetical protein